MNFLIADGGVDPTTSSIVNLIGGLGASGAAVAVVWMFLAFLRGFLSTMNTNFERFQTTMYANFAALSERQSSVMKDTSDTIKEFNRTVNGICKADSQSRRPPSP